MFKKVISLIIVMLFAAASFAVNVNAQGVRTATFGRENAVLSVSSDETYTSAFGISDEKLAELKELIYNAEMNCLSSCDISGFNIVKNDNTVNLILDLVKGDDPTLFHVKPSINYSYMTSGGKSYFTAIRFFYEYTSDVYHSMLSEAVASAGVLLEGIEGNDALSDEMKALLIHDRLAVWCEYDKAYSGGNYPNADYIMYGPLVNRVAVCEGYTKAYSYLLSRVGIENFYCSSSSLNHAWNIVVIDGERYHVDVTWDDPTNDINGRVRHINFLSSTAKNIENGHNASDYDMTPTSTRFDNAFWREAATTSFVLCGDYIYYINESDKSLYRYDGESSVKVMNIGGTWYAPSGGYYPGMYSRLACCEGFICYSTPNQVKWYDPVSGQTGVLYEYASNANTTKPIYGMEINNGVVTIVANESPNFTTTTKRTNAVTFPFVAPVIIHQHVEGEAAAENVVEPGCIDGGSYDLVVYCTVCGEELSRVTVTEPALGHSFPDEYTVEVEPTYTSAGLKSRECTRCGELDDVLIPKLDPLPGDVNGDRLITIRDVAAMKQLLAGIGEFELLVGNTDVSGDGLITLVDLSSLKVMLAS